MSVIFDTGVFDDEEINRDDSDEDEYEFFLVAVYLKKMKKMILVVHL